MSISEKSPIDPALKETVTYPPGRMTEEEFLKWYPEEVRAEWIDGEVIMMSPANTEHSDLFIWLAAVLRFYVERRDIGKVFGPELSVRFSTLRHRRLPDLFFVSNSRLGELRPTHFEGPPDMVLEIVSPESMARDWRDKYRDYEAAGVPEYWIIDPMSQRADLYVLTGGKYRQLVAHEGWLHSTAVSGFCLKTEWFWPATRPKCQQALDEIARSAPSTS